MAVSSGVRRGFSSERIFFTGTGLAMLAVVFLGFGPSYYLRGNWGDANAMPSLTPLIHVHGMVFTAWMIVYIVQCALIGVRRPDLHRQLGSIWGVLIPAMIVTGLWAGAAGIARATAPLNIPPLSWFAVPFFSVIGYAPLMVLGALKRRDSRAHKRLMYLSTTALTSAAVGRIMPGDMILEMVPSLFAVALAIWDWRTLGRVHSVTIWGGILVFVSIMFPLFVMYTEPWLAFARKVAAWGL